MRNQSGIEKMRKQMTKTAKNDITMECDFDLNYAVSDEEQLVILSEKDYRDLFHETDDEQELYGF